jgi:hypothetical protein
MVDAGSEGDEVSKIDESTEADLDAPAILGRRLGPTPSGTDGGPNIGYGPLRQMIAIALGDDNPGQLVISLVDGSRSFNANEFRGIADWFGFAPA